MIRKRIVDDTSDDEAQINKNIAKRTRRFNIRKFPDDDLVCICVIS